MGVERAETSGAPHEGQGVNRDVPRLPEQARFGWMYRFVTLAAVVLLTTLIWACAGGGSESSGAASADVDSVSAGPRCVFAADVRTESGQSLADLSVSVTTMKPVAERRWRGGAPVDYRVAQDGELQVELDCGDSLSLDFGEWTWPVEPGRLIVGPDFGRANIVLVPERMAMLRLQGEPGEPLEGVLHRPAAPGIEAASLKIPVSGLQLDAVSWGGFEGRIEAKGFDGRDWILSRSHDLVEVAPDRYEAVVEMGPSAPVWVQGPDSVYKRITSVSCAGGESTTERCQRKLGGWLCRCGVRSELLVISEGWDAAMLRRPSAGYVNLDVLPDATRQCFEIPSEALNSAGAVFTVSPEGVVVDALSSSILEASSAGQRCVDLPRGEPFVASLGAWSAAFVSGKASPEFGAVPEGSNQPTR